MTESYKQELMDMWLQNVIETHNCIQELNVLNREKQELIKLAESENPPEDIENMLNESKQKFIKLLENSEELKSKAKEIKEKLNKIENQN